jgi:hypothetical protein
MQYLFSSFMHLITCSGLVWQTSGVYTLAEIVALSSSYITCEHVIFNFKIFKIFKVHKIVDSAVLFVAVVCSYQLPAESVCSEC